MSNARIKTETPLSEAAVNRLVATEQEITLDLVQKIATWIRLSLKAPDKTHPKVVDLIKAGLHATRPIEWRDNTIKKILTIDKYRNTLLALLAESVDDPARAPEPCEKCKSGSGEFKYCTTIKDKNGELLLDGACTNCFGFARSHKCSLSPTTSSAKAAGEADVDEAVVESNRYLRIPIRSGSNYKTVKGLWKLLEDITTFTTKFVRAASGAGKATLMALESDELFKVHADHELSEANAEVLEFKRYQAMSKMLTQASGGSAEPARKRKRD